MNTKIIFSLLIIGLVNSCKNENKASDTEAEISETAELNPAAQNENSEWIALFDGNSADGWRSYNGEQGSGLPDGWVIEDGTLKSLGKGGDLGGDIVYEKEKFDEFELELKWKISKGGNSGVFYHIIENREHDAPYWAAPEYQIIDQVGFPEKLAPWQSIGADYGMYNPDFKEDELKEIGEWNTSKIRFTKDKVTYWLNGEKTVEFTPWSQDWEERKASGKWKDYPDYGNAKTGLIGLQDHGSNIWFKGIRIKKL
ncbi:MAG: DUF1080 domain-containing protein [Leeuwenhoekiella sp.]